MIKVLHCFTWRINRNFRRYYYLYIYKFSRYLKINVFNRFFFWYVTPISSLKLISRQVENIRFKKRGCQKKKEKKKTTLYKQTKNHSYTSTRVNTQRSFDFVENSVFTVIGARAESRLPRSTRVSALTQYEREPNDNDK